MRVSEIRVNQIRVNQGLGVCIYEKIRLDKKLIKQVLFSGALIYFTIQPKNHIVIVQRFF